MAAAPATYIQGHHSSVLLTHASRTVANSMAYALPALEQLAAARPALRILDVGCGPGSITADLAQRFPAAHVVGLEPEDGAALQAARAQAAALALTNISFTTGDVHHLDALFGPGAFDVVHAHQLLQHCGDPVGALQQMKGITRAGGFVAVRSADLGAMSVCPPEAPALITSQRIFLETVPLSGGDPRAGARQAKWAREAGFQNVQRGWGVQAWAARAEVQDYARLHAERAIKSGSADAALRHGTATKEELEQMAGDLLAWAEDEDAGLAYVNGEMVCFV